MTAARNLMYEPPPETKKGISIRMPLSLVAELDELVDIWKAQAVARRDAGETDDPANIDRTHVVVTLLRSAVKGEFDLYGGRPSNKEGWDKLRGAIKVGVEKVNSSKIKK